MPPIRSRHDIRDSCLSHMISRLKATKPRLEPYPHFWTDNILPEDIYDRLLEELPESAQYTHGGVGAKHYGNRASLHLLSEWIDQAPEASRELWYGVRLALGSPDLKQTIFTNLAAGFAHRFGIEEEAAPEIEAYPRPILYQETGGYSIAPHPDTRRKLATVQFALTSEESQIDLGTSIYKLSANPKHLLREPRGFCEVQRHPFARNSVFAFAVVNTLTMRSWHGRKALPAGCGKRNTLLHIYYAKAADANPEMLQQSAASANAA